MFSREKLLYKPLIYKEKNKKQTILEYLWKFPVECFPWAADTSNIL